MFSPSTEELYTSIQPGTVVNFTISYTLDNVSYNVSLTPSAEVSTLKVKSGTLATLQGHYKNYFDNVIKYYDSLGKVRTAKNFLDVPSNYASSIFYFEADPRLEQTFYYTAKANNETKIYSIVVKNDFLENRNSLMNRVNQQSYKEMVRVWNKQGRNSSIWFYTTRSKRQVDWISNTWPWTED